MAPEKNPSFLRVFSLFILYLSVANPFAAATAAAAQPFGINYGQKADNIPTPSQVAALLLSLGVNRVKLYDADPTVLAAFADTGVEFTVAINNGQLSNMTNANAASAWVASSILPFVPRTRITGITVGNEVLTGDDTQAMADLLPAMEAVHQALIDAGLAGQVAVSSAHSVAILSNSYPPSAGEFSPALAEFIQPLLNFHAQINSSFLINAYPFFAYKASTTTVSLPYVLFESNAGVADPNTGLTYDNMLYAQIDAVYAAMAAMGHNNIPVRVSETGWPSKGDEDEPGATVANAGTYNGNLLRRIVMRQGTPMRPDMPVDAYVFALFNEDLKPGPTSERNYGLFYPNATPVYDIGLQGSSTLFQSQFFSSSSKSQITRWLSVMTLLAAIFVPSLLHTH